jgi:ABC-type uncharacterized transport system ATPase subunit
MTTVQESAPTDAGALTMFSFDDLLSEIAAKKLAARKDTESWQRLYEVAEELSAAPNTDEEWLRASARWNLVQVSIQGFRGVLNEEPLCLDFDPTPGITILHGLNGAGKSSISDAVDLALTGRTPPTSGGTAGKAALWDPVHLGRGSASAVVEVTLASDETRLILTCSLDDRGQVSSHTAVIVSGADRNVVQLGTGWRQALASHQPVFAYASLERRVQLSKDLAGYFEGLLALGGSFTALQETIAGRGLDATAAAGRWRLSKVKAMQHLDDVDKAHALISPSIELNVVEAPTLDQEPGAWLTESHLREAGGMFQSLPANTLSTLVGAATRTAGLISNFEKAGAETEQYLAHALETLHSEAVARNVAGTICPLCESEQPHWMRSLGESVRRNNVFSDLRTKLLASIGELCTMSTGLLRSALRVGVTADQRESIHISSASGLILLESLEREAAEGLATRHALLTSANALCEWLISADGQSVIEDAVTRTDETKQWQIARAAAVESFVKVWEDDGASAKQAELWSATDKRVEELRVALRKRRSAALEEKAGQRVKELLADAELRLASLSVLSTKASMELLDQNNNSVELGMLSAGQRNAVLLAPLLASVDAGPFGFIVLDDPVHAFDELRIDRLAIALSKIAIDRRVVVLTHDERLKEHLAARIENCDTRLVDRSGNDGAVTVTSSSSFWDQLLTDARDLLDLAIETVGSATDITDTARQLCRMSLDNALRTFAIKNAVQNARDVQADLRQLDAVHKTGDRIDVAASFWAGTPDTDNPVRKAASKCDTYFSGWNHSIHGNPQESDITKEEIRAARDACKFLEKSL